MPRHRLLATFATGALLAGCGRIAFDAISIDQGDGGIDGGTVAPPMNRVFVTSTLQAPGSLGGLAGGDAICAARASEAGLTGTYRAWLSTSAVNAYTRLAGARGWVRPDGRPVVDQVTDLLGLRMIHPLRIDERGADIGAVDTDPLVLTGTYIDGTAISTCGDFAQLAGTGTSGLPWAAGGAWTNRTTQACATPARLYCFQVDLDAPLVITPATGRRAFMSTPTFSPSTGLAAADAVCAADAAAAGIAGSFLAVLPGAGPAVARFNTSGAPYVRVDGVALADTALAWFSGDARAPLNVSAAGGYLGTYVMTGGMTPFEAPDPMHDCNGWSAAGGTSNLGLAAATGPRVFFETTSTCNTASSLYCLEP